MAKIAIMIPFYNVQLYIRRCLDSILAQTFQDFEILLIDDGSTDKSGIICDEYAELDNRIHVIHKKNEGQAITRNKCIDWCMENSDSEWITFIDSDDWIHACYLEMLLNVAIKYDVDISVCDHIQLDDMIEDGKVNLDCIEKIKTETYFIEYNLNSIVPWGKLYRKSLFYDIRYPNIRVHEDEGTTYKVLFKSEFIGVVHFPMYYYFNNTNSVMGRVKSFDFIPERMDVVNIFEDRMIYFKKNNFNSALVYQKQLYLYYVSKQIELILNLSETEYKQKYLPVLRKKLRRFIRKNKKCMDISFEKDISIYELCYPVFMGVYWKLKGLFKN